MGRSRAGRSLIWAEIHGGQIAAVYEISFAGNHPPAVLKVYPDPLHWKMQKEANVLALVEGRLTLPRRASCSRTIRSGCLVSTSS